MIYNLFTNADRINVIMSTDFLYFAIFIFFVLSWLFIALAVYFIPVVIAYVRRHKNILAITLMNIFVGWTFIGWLAALLWSFNSDVESDNDD